MVRTIDITRALAIAGWMAEPELVWLAEQAVEHRCIVEIGSYLGRSTRAMLDHTSGIVYAVDDWKGPRDVYMDREAREELFRQFQVNVGMEKYIPVAERKIQIFQCNHRDIPWYLACMRPDMVFIDGSHEYEDVKYDINLWKAKLVKDGLLCGHDIHMPGVQQAVSELLGDVDVAENTSIWWVKI